MSELVVVANGIASAPVVVRTAYRRPGFQALDADTVFVIGTDDTLWREHAPFSPPGPVPPTREQVDGNVAAYQS